MKITWPQIGLVLAGFCAASIGFLLKRHHLESGVVSNGKTDVLFKVTVRGTGGRAVRNAKISVFDPEQMIIGQTNADGLLETRALLSSGKSAVLQADGIAFKMRRDILIPRSNQYQASVFFDLAEVHGGNATLISTTDSESVPLVVKPSPTPDWLSLEMDHVDVDADAKMRIFNAFRDAAADLGTQPKLHISCITRQKIPSLYECTGEQKDQQSQSFLTQQIPATKNDAAVWLSNVNRMKLTAPSALPRQNETLFVVKHSGQKVRAYFGNTPLFEWKSRNGATVFREYSNSKTEPNPSVELTILSEDGQVLQKNISWPTKRKFVVTRIPKVNLKFSQRNEQR